MRVNVLQMWQTFTVSISLYVTCVR